MVYEPLTQGGGGGGNDSRLHVQDAQPSSGIVTKGDLWSKTDSGNEELLRATSSSTFVSTEGGSSAHDIESATHNFTGTPVDGDLIEFDGCTGDWIPVTPAEAGLSETSHSHGLDDLDDVALCSEAAREIMVNDGCSWINAAMAVGAVVIAANDAPAAIKAMAFDVCDNTDDHVQIQAALDSYDWVILYGREFTGAQLTINGGNRLSGITRLTYNAVVAGLGTSYKLANGTDDSAIVLASTDERMVHLENFWVNGNSSNQCGTSHGIHFDHTCSAVVNARRHILDHVGVWSSLDDGIRIDLPSGLGGGALDLFDAIVINCGGDGVVINGSDALLQSVKIFSCDGDGLVIGDNGGNCQVIGGFSKNNTGDGVSISGGGNRSIFVGWTTQDNEAHGASIARADINFTGCVFDSNGRTSGDNINLTADGDNLQVNSSTFVDRQGCPTVGYHVNNGSGASNVQILGGYMDANAVSGNTNGTINVRHVVGDSSVNNDHTDLAPTTLAIPNAADPTVDSTGKVGIDTTQVNGAGTLNYHDGTAERTLSALFRIGGVSVVGDDITSSEDMGLLWTPVALTVTVMTAVVQGSTPSVTWTIRHGTDRSGAGAEVVTSGTTTTSTTTGSVVTSFDDATIPANSFIWLETTAKSGTVDTFELSIWGVRDPV